MPLLFDDNKLFSIQLKDARKNMNLTQAKCAEYLNISTTFYKELERNQSSPSLELYYKICRNMHISADSCIFPQDRTTSAYNDLLLLISQCSESDLNVFYNYIYALWRLHLTTYLIIFHISCLLLMKMPLYICHLFLLRNFLSDVQ